MPHKILLIDDDKTVLLIVKRMLDKDKYKIVMAYDGIEGLDKFKSENPDLIILDIHMPLMDGLEFFRVLKAQKIVERKPMPPVIVSTSDESMEEVFMREGARGYLLKPMEPASLVGKIEECLSPAM